MKLIVNKARVIACCRNTNWHGFDNKLYASSITHTNCVRDLGVPIGSKLLFQQQVYNTGWGMKCHTIDCARNTFCLLQKHLTPGTELILIGLKIVPNEEHVQCDHRFASQPLANEPLHSSQLSTQVFRKRAAQLHYMGPELRYIFWQLRAQIVKLCRALSEDLCRKV